MSAYQPDVQKVQIGVVLFLAAVYIVQMVTPLRLSTDTVVLLSAAKSAARGGGLLYHGRPTQYPPAYPLFIAALMRLGVANVGVIVGLNVGSILLGLAVVRLFLRRVFFCDEAAALAVCIVSLLSFVTIKYTLIPLTDPLFFGAAMCSLAVMCAAASSFTWRKLALSAVLVLISISIRKIGITLIPALLWMLVGRSEVRRSFAQLSLAMKIALGFLVAFITGALAWLFLATSMTRSFAMIDTASAVIAGHAPIDAVAGILAFRAKELGEIAVNLPYPVLPPLIQHSLPFIGAVVFLLVSGGLFSRRRRLGVVDIFFLSYGLVMLLWPYYDPRFWLPVLPLLIAYIGLSIKYCFQKGISAHIFDIWALSFATLGLLVLVSSTIVSFAGSGFGDRYYTERYHSTYCAAGYCTGVSDLAQPVDSDALQVLQAFK
jgi:hypothetical protein